MKYIYFGCFMAITTLASAQESVYRYVPIDAPFKAGMYLGEERQTYSPLDKVWLDPANTTKVRPPKNIDGMTPVFDGNKWVQKENNIGRFAYNTIDKTTVVVSELGPAPTNFTFIEPSNDCDDWDGLKWVTNLSCESALALEIQQRQKKFDEQNVLIKTLLKKGVITQRDLDAEKIAK